MIEMLNDDAANDYLRLTLYAFDSGCIGQAHFEARLNMLRAIANPQGGAAMYANDLLGEAAEDDGEFGAAGAAGAADEGSAPIENGGVYFDEADHSLAFRMVTGPLKDWEFHQADDDYFPSIPHGHEHGRKQPKLDVYLGWVYNKATQVRRIDRSAIVRLWNDRDFRDFARIAIDYYLTHFPSYSGWSVANPRILPAIRRGRRFR